MVISAMASEACVQRPAGRRRGLAYGARGSATVTAVPAAENRLRLRRGGRALAPRGFGYIRYRFAVVRQTVRVGMAIGIDCPCAGTGVPIKESPDFVGVQVCHTGGDVGGGCWAADGQVRGGVLRVMAGAGL